jgi:alkyl hydroperoxide reductase subunit AhpC
MSSDFEQCGLLRAMLGKKAQNFVATAVTPSSETKSFTLHSLRGSWIVLLFYFSDYADICTEDVLQFSSKLPDFQKANAYILGISTDPIPCHRLIQKLC